LITPAARGESQIEVVSAQARTANSGAAAFLGQRKR